jgi:hypothetical protein
MQMRLSVGFSSSTAQELVNAMFRQWLMGAKPSPALS